MYFTLALLDLGASLTDPTALIFVTGGVMSGFAIALFRGSIGRLFLSGNRDSDSLMNFASMGTLRCICGEQHPAGIAADRRQFCRLCGCEVVATNTAMAAKQLSRREIKAMASSLRRAAIRASYLEVPPTITTISELQEYLDSPETTTLRRKSTQSTQPTQSAQVEQHQVH